MIIPPVTSEFLASSTYIRATSPSDSLDADLDNALAYADRSKSTPELEDLYAKVLHVKWTFSLDTESDSA